MPHPERDCHIYPGGGVERGDPRYDMYGEGGPRPDGTMDGCYVNYPAMDLRDWQHLYYIGNYPKLRRVKGMWDPLNVFHHGQSIELPGHAG